MKAQGGFLTAMVAVNVAVPVLVSWGLRLVPGEARTGLLLIGAAGILALNLWVLRRHPERQRWVWGVIVLNLAALVAFASIAAATALPGLWLLLKTVF